MKQFIFFLGAILSPGIGNSVNVPYQGSMNTQDVRVTSITNSTNIIALVTSTQNIIFANQSNTFTSTQTINAVDGLGYSMKLSSGIFLNNGCVRFGNGSQQCTAGGGGSGTPGGSTQQIQYNNAGSFAGSPNFTLQGTTVVVTYGMSAGSITTTDGIRASSANLTYGLTVTTITTTGINNYSGDMTLKTYQSLSQIIYDAKFSHTFNVNGASVLLLDDSGNTTIAGSFFGDGSFLTGVVSPSGNNTYTGTNNFTFQISTKAAGTPPISVSCEGTSPAVYTGGCNCSAGVKASYPSSSGGLPSAGTGVPDGWYCDTIGSLGTCSVVAYCAVYGTSF